MPLKNRRYKGGGTNEDIDEIVLFLSDLKYDPPFIKKLIIDLLQINKKSEIPENIFYDQHSSWTLKQILLELIKTKNKKNIYFDIYSLLSLHCNEYENNNDINELTEEIIKQEINKLIICLKKKIKKDILDFFKQIYNDEFLKKILIRKIFHFTNTNVNLKFPPIEYYNSYKDKNLDELLQNLLPYYQHDKNKLYIDILLYLRNNNTDTIQNLITEFENNEETIKNKILELIINSGGGSFKRQIIKKVIRKY